MWTSGGASGVVWAWVCIEGQSLCSQKLLCLQMNFLRKAFDVLQQLLSFDVISQLPIEISKMIFSYLSAPSLCLAAACCRKWREIADDDSLWCVFVCVCVCLLPMILLQAEAMCAEELHETILSSTVFHKVPYSFPTA